MDEASTSSPPGLGASAAAAAAPPTFLTFLIWIMDYPLAMDTATY